MDIIHRVYLSPSPFLVHCLFFFGPPRRLPSLVNTRLPAHIQPPHGNTRSSPPPPHLLKTLPCVKLKFRLVVTPCLLLLLPACPFAILPRCIIPWSRLPSGCLSVQTRPPQTADLHISTYLPSCRRRMMTGEGEMLMVSAKGWQIAL